MDNYTTGLEHEGEENQKLHAPAPSLFWRTGVYYSERLRISHRDLRELFITGIVRRGSADVPRDPKKGYGFT